MVSVKYKNETISRTKMRNNIRRIWNETSQEERRDWYSEAFMIAHTSKYDTIKMIGVIAALSPLRRWEINIKIAFEFMETGDCGQMMQLKDKARRIVSSNGTESEILDILNGPKIKAFFLNILHHDRNTNVTVDRHATELAMNKVYGDDVAGLSESQYLFFQEQYRAVANEIGVMPNRLQSATWLRWRYLKAVA